MRQSYREKGRAPVITFRQTEMEVQRKILEISFKINGNALAIQLDIN